MAKLSISLPPFSPDYSGAGAIFFDLNAVAVIHDASGCTGNYAGHDEPRWFGAQAKVFCSGLREIDVILGDDAKVEARMKKAAETFRPEVMALIGSPVPMVTGIDVRGIAAEVEAETGVPCIGVDTNGMEYYDRGAYKAASALADRFTEAGAPVEAGRVNLLGATPLDFHLGENLDLLQADLERRGYRVGLRMAMGYSLEDVRNAARAQVNIAVSRFGYLLARHMEEKFRTPYLCGMPVGRRGSGLFYEALARVCGGGKSEVLGRVPGSVAGRVPSSAPDSVAGRVPDSVAGRVPGGVTDSAPGILLLGEQVSCNAMRLALSEYVDAGRIAVGCIFGKEDQLAAGQDLDLKDEAQIRRAIRGTTELVIADPVFRCLLPEEGAAAFADAALFAISSKENAACYPEMVGERFNKWFEKFEKRGERQHEKKMVDGAGSYSGDGGEPLRGNGGIDGDDNGERGGECCGDSSGERGGDSSGKHC